MPLDPFGQRIGALLAFPSELLEFQRWLALQPSAPTVERDYLFSEPRPRFEPRKDDVVTLLPGLELKRRGGVTFLASDEPKVELEIGGVSGRDAERIIGAIDGARCLLEVRWEAGVDQSVLARFLRGTFGKVVFAPAAVEALERELSGVDITRFVAPPYAIERPYWENMIAVRARWQARPEALESPQDTLELMRELHVLAVMGPRLDSFYKPASPVADQVVAPGSLYLVEPRLIEGARGTIFLDGPRVKVPLLGGARYHHLLCAELGDPGATLPTREHRAGELSWGRVVTARSEKDELPAPWFCPPRPLTWAHFEHLHEALSTAANAAESGERDVVIDGLARFHQAWVRLHPFHCANQSVAMNVVGALLARSHGAGIPHGILDHFALRLATEPYVRLFRRAVAAHLLVDHHPAKRYARLAERRDRSFSMIERIEACASDEAARVLIAENPEAARAALLADG